MNSAPFFHPAWAFIILAAASSFSQGRLVAVSAADPAGDRFLGRGRCPARYLRCNLLPGRAPGSGPGGPALQGLRQRVRHPGIRRHAVCHASQGQGTPCGRLLLRGGLLRQRIRGRLPDPLYLLGDDERGERLSGLARPQTPGHTGRLALLSFSYPGRAVPAGRSPASLRRGRDRLPSPMCCRRTPDISTG